MISHTHNQCTWTPSHGQPLTPDGYRDLFETIEPRVVGESGLFADVVNGGPLDLSRASRQKALEADPALTIVATRHRACSCRTRSSRRRTGARGEFRVNPLYAVSGDVRGARSRSTCGFRPRTTRRNTAPAGNTCPRKSSSPREALSALAAGRVPVALADLLRRRVIVDLPRGYDCAVGRHYVI